MLYKIIQQFAFVIFPTIIFCVLSLLPQGNQLSADDWTISCMLDPEYKVDKPCLFINSVLSYVTIFLNRNISFFNWFFVLERMVVYFALLLYSYIQIKRSGLLNYLIILAIISIFFLHGCLVEANFTYIAAFITFAGFTSFINLSKSFHDEKRLRIALSIFSLVFIIFGFMLRLQAFLLMLPFVFLYFIYAHKDLIKSHKKKSKELIREAIPLLLIVAVCSSLYFIDLAIWDSSDLSAWKSYNAERSRISDYEMPRYEDIDEELENIGVSENDYWLVTHWINDDPDFFTTDLLSQIADIRDTYYQSQDQESLFKVFGNYFLWLSSQVFAIVFLVLSLCLLLKYRSKKHLFLLLILLVVTNIISFYFFDLGRLIPRVAMPIWGACYATFISCLNNSNTVVRSQNNVFKLSQEILITLCVALITTIFIFVQGLASSPRTNTDSLLDQLRDSKEASYYWDTASMHAYQDIYSKHYLPEANVLDSNFKLGGWTTESPQTNYMKTEKNAEGGIKALINNDTVFYMANSKSDISERLLVYLKEHYSNNINCEVVKMLTHQNQEFIIYKFISSEL